ncbi:MAG: hypothetical protein WBS33_13445 [Verrucomicrobiia bacterium]
MKTIAMANQCQLSKRILIGSFCCSSSANGLFPFGQVGKVFVNFTLYSGAEIYPRRKLLIQIARKPVAISFRFVNRDVQHRHFLVAGDVHADGRGVTASSVAGTPPMGRPYLAKKS